MHYSVLWTNSQIMQETVHNINTDNIFHAAHACSRTPKPCRSQSPFFALFVPAEFFFGWNLAPCGFFFAGALVSRLQSRPAARAPDRGATQNTAMCSVESWPCTSELLNGTNSYDVDDCRESLENLIFSRYDELQALGCPAASTQAVRAATELCTVHAWLRRLSSKHACLTTGAHCLLCCSIDSA